MSDVNLPLEIQPFVVATQEQLGVVEANLTDGWRRRLAGAFAFPDIEVK